jgi:hypothetical protein
MLRLTRSVNDLQGTMQAAGLSAAQITAVKSKDPHQISAAVQEEQGAGARASLGITLTIPITISL